jgi:hypothetical protein
MRKPEQDLGAIRAWRKTARQRYMAPTAVVLRSDLGLRRLVAAFDEATCRYAPAADRPVDKSTA